MISDERDKLLDTGGGVVKALGAIGNEPFIHVNSDTIWIDGVKPNLEKLAEAFDPAQMDALLLLAPVSMSIGYTGRGRFHHGCRWPADAAGERDVAPFVYAGVAILRPELFKDAPDGAFSLTMLFDRAAAAGRLHGLRMEGVWSGCTSARHGERPFRQGRGGDRRQHGVNSQPTDLQPSWPGL